MQTFWIGITICFVLTVVCSLVNKQLFNAIKELTPWLKVVMKPAYTESGQVLEARKITKDDLPLLQEWETGCMWYGIVVLVLQVLLFSITGLVKINNSLPYIFVLVSAMMMGSMIMFLPRTYKRRKTIQEMARKYESDFMLIEAKSSTKKADEILNGSNITDDRKSTRT